MHNPYNNDQGSDDWRKDEAEYAEWRRRRRENHRDGYAYHAGDPGPGPNMFRLRRDVKNKMLTGVCAGIARFFGYPVEWVRLGWVAFFFISGGGAVLFYLGASVILRPDQDTYRMASSPEEERFWKTFSFRPQATFSELKHRFRALETRISNIEYMVTSDEYGLRKAFRDLEKGR